jgi:hypothetical protein
MSSVASDPPTEPEPYAAGCSVLAGHSIVKKHTVCEIILQSLLYAEGYALSHVCNTS